MFTQTDPPSLLALCRSLSRESAVCAKAVAELSDPVRRATVFGLAYRENLLPALYDSISLFPGHVPRIERIPLALGYEENRRKNRQIHKAIIEIANEANQQCIQIVVLKGSTWVMDDPVDYSPWRWMRDIDLLVDPKNYDEMPNVLTRLNYKAMRRERNIFGGRRFGGHYHLVASRRGNDPFSIEVHRHIGWRPTLLPNEEIFRSARKIAPGLSLPCPWHAALHAIIHWQIHHYGYQFGLQRVTDGMEIARFLQRRDVDWTALAEHATRTDIGPECDAAIATAVELFGATAPHPFRTTKAGLAYVARSLQKRESRILMWRVKQQQRVLRLWNDHRFIYRMTLRNTHPLVTSLGLWVLRIQRFPFLVSHLASIILLQLTLCSRQAIRACFGR
jgi:hypothetical protein